MTRTILFRRIVGVVGCRARTRRDRRPGLGQNLLLQLKRLARSAASPEHLCQRPIPASGGSSIEWGYVAIGSSAAALALIAVGAGLAVPQRRRRRTRQSAA